MSNLTVTLRTRFLEIISVTLITMLKKNTNFRKISSRFPEARILASATPLVMNNRSESRRKNVVWLLNVYLLISQFGPM